MLVSLMWIDGLYNHYKASQDIALMDRLYWIQEMILLVDYQVEYLKAQAVKRAENTKRSGFKDGK